MAFNAHLPWLRRETAVTFVEPYVPTALLRAAAGRLVNMVSRKSQLPLCLPLGAVLF